ncbi:MAG: SAM-dependent methyltransferase [Alphaproteobacteria bacterium]|nr:SAM-dependent methyltransferase [Alphaproteobacteria bacterium]
MTEIGTVRSSRDAAIDDAWNAVQSRIEIDPAQFTPGAVESLDGFSHIEVLFVFDRVPETEIERGSRHPRGRTDWPRVGIFAQRGKGRPNRIGLCTCQLLRVEGLTLHVKGLDAIDGTPVLDIKPYMKGFGPRGTVREPEWAAQIMAFYW